MTKILILECPTIDINFIFRELDRDGFNYTAKNIKLLNHFEHGLSNYNPDIIFSGYSLLGNNGKEALKISRNWYSSTPLILIADHIEVENCIELIKKGVSDIILRQNISSLTQKISKALTKTATVNFNIFSNQEEKYLKEKAKYSSLTENSRDAIFLTLKDGPILEANPAACQIFKMTEEEIYKTGRLGLVDPNDPYLPVLIEERDLRGLAKGELNFKRKDGTSFPGEITTVVFKDVWGRDMTSITIKDLTEYKKDQQELAASNILMQESLNGLNKIMDASLDLICSIDEEKRFVNVSAASKSLWGYEPHELIGEKYIHFIYIEDHKITNNTYEDITNGTPVTIFENRINHKDGSIVNMLWSVQWDDDEKLLYCTIKDISEKKKLKKAYKVERDRFLDLYNLSPACMGILKGPNHIHELTNPLYLKFINKKNVIGKSIIEVLPELKNQGFIKLLDDVYNTGIPFIANEMLVQLDFHGKGLLADRYMNFIYQPHRDAYGKIDGIFVFAIDVTEQLLSRMKIEESEKLYRQLIKELPVAAYSCDVDGKITLFNKAAAILWGREPQIGIDSWCGSWKALSTDGQEIPLEMYPIAVVLREGKTMTGKEIIIERENGDRRYVLPHAVPYIDQSGKVTGAVNLLTDITESKAIQKALEEHNMELSFQNLEKVKRAAELNIANKELAYQNCEKEKRAEELILTNIELLKTNKELDRFVYSISHDLRSPLTSVQGLVSIIEDESEDPATLKHIQMIKNSIERLDEFIKKILSYSQNNRTELDIETISVKKTILNIVDCLQNMKQANGIHFEIDVQELSPFSTDKLRFNTIMENLISNAIKYHKMSGTERFIKVKAIVNEQVLQLEIADNGIGIPLQHQEKIFDMFFRISSKSEGSGIGLYIVKDTIEKLEGSINILSQPKAGTTFKMNLKNFKIC